MNVRTRLSSFAADVLALVLRATGRRNYRRIVNALWEKHPFAEASGSPLEVGKEKLRPGRPNWLHR